MFPSLNLVKALPFVLMLSTALAKPVPETSSTSDLGKRTIGNDATYLYCVTPDYECGFLASYTNGDTQQAVSWTSGSPSTDVQVITSNYNLCAVSQYQKQTNDAGFWFDAEFNFEGTTHTIGYDSTGDSIDLGDSSWTATDQNYLNDRCSTAFGSDFSNVSTDNGSAELNWYNLDQTLY